MTGGNIFAGDAPKIYADISNFKINTDITRFLKKPCEGSFLLVGPSEILPFILVSSNSYLYKVAFYNNVVKYIFVDEDTGIFHLNASPFKTDDGIFIGMTFENLCRIMPNIELKKVNGWAYVASLPSGWKIGFSTGNTGTNYYPNSDSTVTMIYRD
jgi:hypothetical protein